MSAKSWDPAELEIQAYKGSLALSFAWWATVREQMSCGVFWSVTVKSDNGYTSMESLLKAFKMKRGGMVCAQNGITKSELPTNTHSVSLKEDSRRIK